MSLDTWIKFAYEQATKKLSKFSKFLRDILGPGPLGLRSDGLSRSGSCVSGPLGLDPWPLGLRPDGTSESAS